MNKEEDEKINIERKRAIGESMPRLHNISNFLTERHLPEVLHQLKLAGVNIKGRKLRGYRLFNAVRGQNVLQVVFLNLALPIVVTNILRKYGCNLRNEFKSNIAHAHSTLLSDREFFLLKEWQKELVRKLGEVILEVEIIGIIAISNENDICLGLEVEVPGNKELRDKFKYRAMVNPHITTSHMWRKDYHEKLELIVFNSTGIRDEYLYFLSKDKQNQIRPVQKAVQKEAVQKRAVKVKAVHEPAVQGMDIEHQKLLIKKLLLLKLEEKKEEETSPATGLKVLK